MEKLKIYSIEWAWKAVGWKGTSVVIAKSREEAIAKIKNTTDSWDEDKKILQIKEDEIIDGFMLQFYGDQ